MIVLASIEYSPNNLKLEEVRKYVDNHCNLINSLVFGTYYFLHIGRTDSYFVGGSDCFGHCASVARTKCAVTQILPIKNNPVKWDYFFIFSFSLNR